MSLKRIGHGNGIVSYIFIEMDMFGGSGARIDRAYKLVELQMII